MGALSSTPRILGRYALYSELASGGMGTVHLARLIGASGFTKTVAIKCLHPQFAKDPEFVGLFLDEARLAARIQHPNVVSTLDVVALEGALFLVMEYVQGESLARLCRAAKAVDERIPPGVAAAVMAGTLHGLHAAHDAVGVDGEPLHIVHRDVSPQNILVGKDGTARVLDFGVAKASGRSIETRDGVIKGKLPYMAPEQFSGQVSSATDVYAAAVVLWEILVGRRLFRGENEAQTLKLVLYGEIEAPSKFVAGIPPALDAIVLRGLSRDPALRFPSARDMARALEKSVPLATASDVGELVAHLAAPTLAERARQVSFIESASLTLPLDHDPAQAFAETTAPLRRESSPNVSSGATPLEGDPQTQLATISDELPAPPRPFLQPRTVAVAAAILVTVGLVAVLAIRPGGTARSTDPAKELGAPALATSVVNLPGSASGPTADPSAATPAAAATEAEPSGAAVQPVARASAQAVAPTATPRASSRPEAPRPKATSKHNVNCSPPYTVDAQNFRHYKRECE